MPWNTLKQPPLLGHSLYTENVMSNMELRPPLFPSSVFVLVQTDTIVTEFHTSQM